MKHVWTLDESPARAGHTFFAEQATELCNVKRNTTQQVQVKREGAPSVPPSAAPPQLELLGWALSTCVCAAYTATS